MYTPSGKFHSNIFDGFWIFFNTLCLMCLDLRSYNETDPSTNKTDIVRDLIAFYTFPMSQMKFTVPLNKSIKCTQLVSLSMWAELHKSNAVQSIG